LDTKQEEELKKTTNQVEAYSQTGSLKATKLNAERKRKSL
jgi:hypothetical protein